MLVSTKRVGRTRGLVTPEEIKVAAAVDRLVELTKPRSTLTIPYRQYFTRIQDTTIKLTVPSHVIMRIEGYLC